MVFYVPCMHWNCALLIPLCVADRRLQTKLIRWMHNRSKPDFCGKPSLAMNANMMQYHIIKGLSFLACFDTWIILLVFWNICSCRAIGNAMCQFQHYTSRTEYNICCCCWKHPSLLENPGTFVRLALYAVRNAISPTAMHAKLHEEVASTNGKKKDGKCCIYMLEPHWNQR